MNVSDSYTIYIDKLIRLGVPFAFYRKPGEEIEFVVQTEGDVCSLDTIDELDACSGYVMAPFAVTERNRIVVIRPDCVRRPDLELFLQEKTGSDRLPDTERISEDSDCCATERDYESRIAPFLKALRAGEFDKLVLSRKQSFGHGSALSVGSAFRDACMRYTRSYVYVCYTPQSGLWLGSTPEIILSGEEGQWHTVALAGTQSMAGNELPTDWSAKNRREQAYVAEYIRSILESKGRNLSENGPFVVQAGALAHLKTTFDFQLNASCSPAQLVALLHPTPAVCGLPKEESFRFILEHEGYDRSYYSGFTGCWNLEGKTDLYVNLRCMRCLEHRSVLYAGGGILKSSDVHEEWLETVKKMQTMCRLFLEDGREG